MKKKWCTCCVEAPLFLLGKKGQLIWSYFLSFGFHLDFAFGLEVDLLGLLPFLLGLGARYWGKKNGYFVHFEFPFFILSFPCFALPCKNLQNKIKMII